MNTTADHVRRTGRKRTPVLDTGHSRIRLSRTCRYHQNRATTFRVVSVSTVQTVLRDGKLQTALTTVGQISEIGYRKSPQQAKEQLDRYLNEALAIVRLIERAIDSGRPPKRLLSLNDLPKEMEVPEGNWDHLDLEAILFGIPLKQAEFSPTTTFGDKDELASTLKRADLRKPRKPVALNGFHLKFKPLQVGAETFYLPTGIYRVEHGWRLFLRHEEGVWHDYFKDSQSTIYESLIQAWGGLIGAMLARTAPRERLAPVTNQAAFTGIEGGNLLIGFRNGSWRIQLRYAQTDSRGKRYLVSLRYWRALELNDGELRQALRELAAMDSYRRYLIQKTGDPDIVVTRETSIPLKFFPGEPVVPILADDLIYSIEQRST
ncbi:hypothetical protein [Hydrocarboniclastica marina]|uniref:Uncharacterized protein n=1 Tax=Hydrocarboniclastica marina TaxID=2259620 RepID=A0A4P7XLB7_9ALTE|nr:hypothetical protein [Hydrocarboniclastica marina]QCF28039.1 hypothetical protein soil367_18370 [Hydrocarboniclastica marina]